MSRLKTTDNSLTTFVGDIRGCCEIRAAKFKGDSRCDYFSLGNIVPREKVEEDLRCMEDDIHV